MHKNKIKNKKIKNKNTEIKKKSKDTEALINLTGSSKKCYSCDQTPLTCCQKISNVLSSHISSHFDPFILHFANLL